MSTTPPIQILVNSGKVITSKVSAALIQNNTSELAREIPKAQELGLQCYCYNITNKGLPPDQVAADQMVSFAKAVGVRVDLIIDILSANWQDYLKWAITQFDLNNTDALVTIGFETIDELDEQQYIDIVNEVYGILANAKAQKCLDAGLIYRESRNTQERIDACAQINPLIQPSERQYTQLAPDRMVFTSDMNHNHDLMKTYFDVTLPFEWLDPTNPDSCVSRMPSKAIVDLQWHWQDFVKQSSNTDYVTGTPLSAWGVGKMATFVLSNTNQINYLCWMSNNNLYSNPTTPNPNWYDLKRIAQLFKYKYSLPITITGLTGLSGRAFRNEKNDDGTTDYALLITNESATGYTLTTNQIALIGGGKIQGSITIDSGHGDRSWGGTTINEIYDYQDFLIKGFSCNVFKFKGKKTTVAGS